MTTRQRKNEPEHIDLAELNSLQRLRVGSALLFAKNKMTMVLVGLVAIWFGVSVAVLWIEHDVAKATIKTLPEALWWGLVTFMTVGYGDYTPVTAAGRSVSVILMFGGVAAISIVTAKISSYFIEQILLEGRGVVDKNKLVDHFIICGWKEDMADLLDHVMQFNPDLKSQDIVIIANISPEEIALLKASPKLKDLKLVGGDFYQHATLERAAPAKARKILILADATVGPTGLRPTSMEADARTIMTAIALSDLAKGTVVAAEILDPNLDNYLKMAGVGEIIYSREYSRLLLGSASCATGVANIFHDLIDPRMGARIGTSAIPEGFHGKTYRDFRNDFEDKQSRSLVIGILEHTGNPHKIKEEAFRDAQKTASVSRLIENLKTAKSLRCNNPVFHPPGDYKIVKGSVAITLTRVDDEQQARGGSDRHGLLSKVFAA